MRCWTLWNMNMPSGFVVYGSRFWVYGSGFGSKDSGLVFSMGRFAELWKLGPF